jgi:hypothetical protein
VLAGLGHDRLKPTKPELAEALTGRLSEHQGFLAKLHPDLIGSFTVRIGDLTTRIEPGFSQLRV